MTLEGKVAIVTGGAQGMGQAISLRIQWALVALGNKLILLQYTA